MIPDPQTVSSRGDFVAFVAALEDDLRNRREDWENPTLDHFLEALAAYANDAPGYLRNSGSALEPDVASWQLFALLLAGARAYE